MPCVIKLTNFFARRRAVAKLILQMFHKVLKCSSLFYLYLIFSKNILIYGQIHDFEIVGVVIVLKVRKNVPPGPKISH